VASCRLDTGGQRAQDWLGGCGDGGGSRVIGLSARRCRERVRAGSRWRDEVRGQAC